MKDLELTRLSSKGQVVLPQAVRKRLRLKEGVRFVVIASGDTVILKRLEVPAGDQVRELLKASRDYAQRAGLTPKDIDKAIREVRSK